MANRFVVIGCAYLFSIFVREWVSASVHGCEWTRLMEMGVLFVCALRAYDITQLTESLYVYVSVVWASVSSSSSVCRPFGAWSSGSLSFGWFFSNLFLHSFEWRTYTTAHMLSLCTLHTLSRLNYVYFSHRHSSAHTVNIAYSLCVRVRVCLYWI